MTSQGDGREYPRLEDTTKFTRSKDSIEVSLELFDPKLPNALYYLEVKDKDGNSDGLIINIDIKTP